MVSFFIDCIDPDLSSTMVISSVFPHHGEEPPISGTGGSGTVFFSYCTLQCCFCQNFQLSHEAEGRIWTPEELAEKMIGLQAAGCHNINFVSPSHVVPQILSALEIAVDKGLQIPLVYNTGGYDRVKTLKLLEGIIDIYMPDFKFWDNKIAERACTAPDYREVACRALTEMHRQVGDLVLDDSQVVGFSEKSQTGAGWINGGFFDGGPDVFLPFMKIG